jgi:hypothetical protein
LKRKSKGRRQASRQQDIAEGGEQSEGKGGSLRRSGATNGELKNDVSGFSLVSLV